MGQARSKLLEIAARHGLDPKQHEMLMGRAMTFLVDLHACEREADPLAAKKTLITRRRDTARHNPEPLRTALREFYDLYEPETPLAQPVAHHVQGIKEVNKIRRRVIKKPRRGGRGGGRRNGSFRHFEEEIEMPPMAEDNVHAHLSGSGEVILEEDSNGFVGDLDDVDPFT